MSRFVDVRLADVAQPAGDHDRLVVAAHAAAIDLLERAEVAADGRPAELVVERRRADRAVDHDLQRRHDAIGLAVIVVLPRLHEPGHPQVRHAEPDQPGLRAAPRSPTAPSSRISPPDPVDAPGYGAMAVGWLCVSTFIMMCTGSSCERERVRCQARERSGGPRGRE